MGKLVAATEHRCAGLTGDPKHPVQIETTANEGAHDIAVQHDAEWNTRVLCGYVRGRLCSFFHRETKGGGYKPSKKEVPCPFAAGPVGEKADK